MSDSPLDITGTFRVLLEEYDRRGMLEQLGNDWLAKNPAIQDYSFSGLDAGVGEAIKNTPIGKSGIDNDALLRKVAEFSKPQREEAITTQRARQWRGVLDGSFSSALVIPDTDTPENSKVLVLERQRAIGAGYGSPGGLLDQEGDDFTPLREWEEEFGELIETDAQRDTLQSLLKKEHFQPLFSCRDDAHVIERGWGKCINATAHVLLLPEALRKPATELFNQLSQSRKSGFETKGCRLFSLKDLPQILGQYHYGHEAFGSLVGAQITLMDSGVKATDYNVIDHVSQKQLAGVAQKMRLTTDDLRALYANVLIAYEKGTLASPGEKPTELCPTDIQYVNAFRTREAMPLINADSAEKSGTIHSLAAERYSRLT